MAIGADNDFIALFVFNFAHFFLYFIEIGLPVPEKKIFKGFLAAILVM